MRKKNKAGGITISDTKLYYKATVMKTAWYWHKNRHINQWNKVESPEINPSPYGFNKGGRTIKWGKNSSSTNGVGRSGQLQGKKCNLITNLHHTKKINSRWIKDLNISSDTIQVLEENIGRKISDILCRNIFTICPLEQGT